MNRKTGHYPIKHSPSLHPPESVRYLPSPSTSANSQVESYTRKKSFLVGSPLMLGEGADPRQPRYSSFKKSGTFWNVNCIKVFFSSEFTHPLLPCYSGAFQIVTFPVSALYEFRRRFWIFLKKPFSMSEFAGFKNRYMLIYIYFFLNIKALAGLSKLQFFFTCSLTDQ